MVPGVGAADEAGGFAWCECRDVETLLSRQSSRALRRSRRARNIESGQGTQTLTIDEDALRWVKIRGARTGVSDSAVIEESLHRDLKLDVLDELWGKRDDVRSRASELAVEAQHATRPGRRASAARGR
jgi:hypothetical protein